MKKKGIVMKLIMSVLVLQFMWAQQMGSIEGRITDIKNNEALVSVNVSVIGTSMGSSSDENGQFIISNLSPASYKLRFDYVGYQSYIESDLHVKPGRSIQLTIRLSEEIMNGEDIVVTASYFRQNTSDPISVVSFNAEEIRRSPGAGGEISRILNSLPSVSSRGENSQDIMVRGGSPIENLFIVDNIPIPSIRHFESMNGHSNGPTGMINADLINDVQFYNGAFSAPYGNYLSSVTEIAYKEGNYHQYNGHFSLDFAGFSGFFEGPILNNKQSFFVSGRRSYLDIIAGLIGFSGAPRYEDVQLKTNFELSDNHRLNSLLLFAKSSYDGTDLETANENEQEFLPYSANDQFTAGVNWAATWSKNAFSNTSISFTQRGHILDVKKLDQSTVVTKNDNTLKHIILRSKTFLAINEKNHLDLGFDLFHSDDSYFYFFKADTLYSGESFPDLQKNIGLKSTRSSLFANLSSELSEHIIISLGLRADYNDLNSDWDLAPRAKFRYAFDNTLALNLGYAHVYQSIPSYLSSHNPENQSLPSMKAEHFVAGLEKILTEDSKVSFEAYYKNYSQMPVNQSSLDPVFPIDLQGGRPYISLNSNGKSRSYGVELFYQKKLAVDFYGMLSISYYRSEYKTVNSDWIRRDFDNQFSFSVIGGYKPNDSHEFSVRWTYMGSAPYTPFDVTQSKLQKTAIYDLSKINQEDYPAYHSLFIRYDYRIAYESSNLVTYFSIWNAYNRQNVVSYQWNGVLNKSVTNYNMSIIPVGGVKYEF